MHTFWNLKLDTECLWINQKKKMKFQFECFKFQIPNNVHINVIFKCQNSKYECKWFELCTIIRIWGFPICTYFDLFVILLCNVEFQFVILNAVGRVPLKGEWVEIELSRGDDIQMIQTQAISLFENKRVNIIWMKWIQKCLSN